MKITVSIIIFILCLVSFIYHLLKIPKKVKEYRLTGKVDYDPKTGYSALYPKGQIGLYCFYAGCFLFNSIVLGINIFMLLN